MLLQPCRPMAVQAAWLLASVLVLFLTAIYWWLCAKGTKQAHAQSSGHTLHPSVQSSDAPNAVAGNSVCQTTGCNESASPLAHGDAHQPTPGTMARTEKHSTQGSPQLLKSKSARRGQAAGANGKSKGVDMLGTSDPGNLHKVDTKQSSGKQGGALSMHGQSEQDTRQYGYNNEPVEFLLNPPEALYAAAVDKAAMPSVRNISPGEDVCDHASGQAALAASAHHARLSSAGPASGLDKGMDQATPGGSLHPITTPPSTHKQGVLVGSSTHHHDFGVQVGPMLQSATSSVKGSAMVEHDAGSLIPASAVLSPQEPPLLATIDSVSSMHPFLPKNSQQLHSRSSTIADVPLPSLPTHKPTAAALCAPDLHAIDAVLSMHTEMLQPLGGKSKSVNPVHPYFAPITASVSVARDAKSASLDGGLTSGSIGRTSSSGSASGTLPRSSPASSATTTCKPKKEKKSNPIASIGSSLLATIRERSSSGISLLHGGDSKDKPRAMFSGKDGEKRAFFRNNKVSPTPTFYAMVHPKPSPIHQEEQEQWRVGSKKQGGKTLQAPHWAHTLPLAATPLPPVPEPQEDLLDAIQGTAEPGAQATVSAKAAPSAKEGNSPQPFTETDSDGEKTRLRQHALSLTPLLITDNRPELGGILPIIAPRPVDSARGAGEVMGKVGGAGPKHMKEAGEDRLGPEDEELLPGDLNTTPTPCAFLAAGTPHTSKHHPIAQLSAGQRMLSLDGTDPHSSAYSMFSHSSSLKRRSPAGQATHMPPQHLAPGPDTPRSHPSTCTADCAMDPQRVGGDNTATSFAMPTRMSTANDSLLSSPNPNMSGARSDLTSCNSPLRSLWSMPSPFAQPLADVQHGRRQPSATTLPAILSVASGEEGGAWVGPDGSCKRLRSVKSLAATGLAFADSLERDLNQLPALNTAIDDDDEAAPDAVVASTRARPVSRSIADAVAAEQQRGTAATARAAAGAWANAEGLLQMGVGPSPGNPTPLALPDILTWVGAHQLQTLDKARPVCGEEQWCADAVQPAMVQPTPTDYYALPEDLQDEGLSAATAAAAAAGSSGQGTDMLTEALDTVAYVSNAIELAQQLEEVAQWLRLQSGGSIPTPVITGQPTSILSRNPLGMDNSIPTPPSGPDALSSQLNAARALLNTLAVVYSNGEGVAGQAAMAAAVNAATVAARELLVAAMEAAQGQSNVVSGQAAPSTAHNVAQPHTGVPVMPNSTSYSTTPVACAPAHPPLSPGAGPTAVPMQPFPMQAMHVGHAGGLRLQAQGLHTPTGVPMTPNMVPMTPAGLQHVVHAPHLMVPGSAPSPVTVASHGLSVMVPGVGPAQLVNVNGNMVLLPQTLHLMPMHMHPSLARDHYSSNLTTSVVSIKHGASVPGAALGAAPSQRVGEQVQAAAPIAADE